jgi:hypothetical protein
LIKKKVGRGKEARSAIVPTIHVTVIRGHSTVTRPRMRTTVFIRTLCAFTVTCLRQRVSLGLVEMDRQLQLHFQTESFTV